MYQVYALRSSNEHLPFYIGYTARERRFYEHMHQAKSGKQSHKCNKIRKIQEDGFEVLFEILTQHNTEEAALETENFLVSSYGRRNNNTGILTNMDDGGSQGPTGYKWTKKTRDDKSVSMKGNKNAAGSDRSDNRRTQGKKTYQFNADGTLFKKYDSLIEASEKTDIHKGKISKAAINENSTSGYYWSYNPNADFSDKKAPRNYKHKKD